MTTEKEKKREADLTEEQQELQIFKLKTKKGNEKKLER